MHLSPPQWLRMLSVLRRWFCCCWLLFIDTPIVGVCNCSKFCCTLLYVHSSLAIILMRKRELVALLNSSSWWLVMVVRLFLAVPQGCLGVCDCGISWSYSLTICIALCYEGSSNLGKYNWYCYKANVIVSILNMSDFGGHRVFVSHSARTLPVFLIP